MYCYVHLVYNTGNYWSQDEIEGNDKKTDERRNVELRQEDFFISPEYCISCEGEDSYNSISEQLAQKRNREDVVSKVLLPAEINPTSAFAFLQ